MILTFDNDISRILLNKEEIETITTGIAAEISMNYENKNPLLVCILKGSFMFFADIVKKISIPCTVDFIQVSSYGSSTVSSGKIKLIKDISSIVADRNVLLVDDIIDTGFTLFKLRKYFINERNAASVSICTMLDKPSRRVYDIKPDYTCAVISDEFVVGYGLDYDEHYRNLPYIGVLKRNIYEKSY